MPSHRLTNSLFVAVLICQCFANTSPDVWSRFWDPCPRDCGGTTSPAEWAIYNGVNRLDACNKTARLDFSLYNPSDPIIRACSTSLDTQVVDALGKGVSSQGFEDQEVTLQIGWWQTASSSPIAGVKSAVEQVQNVLLSSDNDMPTTTFSYSGNCLVGLYAGAGVQHSDAATVAVKQFTNYIESQDSVGRVAMQYCGLNSDKALGIVVDTTGNLSAVQLIVKDWNDAKCQTDFDGAKDISKSALRLKSFRKLNSSIVSSRRDVDYDKSLLHSHQRRADCRAIKVASGDSCESLADECGISPTDFTKYNPDDKLCSSLQSGMHVCCSAGDMPDFSPKPNEDGTCASTIVRADDSCAKLANANSISQDNLEEWNKNTWGWMGCKKLQAQQKICLSKGDPPMPSTIDNAVCGPQVPGTKKPTDGTKLADLNPCPLKACCNVWGQCGITGDFCEETKSSTGAPGTAANGTNGCISNCGTGIVNNDNFPDEFIAIGYYEAWNSERDCLTMDVTAIDSAVYTHVHFAFAEITDDYQVDVSKVQDQFEKLKGMGSIQRILSFGGWSFSTEADSFPIFREGVSDANREHFATNVAKFIDDNDLEGVDFDWEYPGAPDIPGIPAGDPGDGDRYLEFLKVVREKLSDDKSLAIAVPASYWYLKGFPIAQISDVVDYIVFMSYDLHGQWDYGNKYASPGCPKGDCLRSHVNLTETTSSLSMITKAGVPASKIIVGVSSYGRSFKMNDAGCTGPMCTYSGPESGATPGKCTNTAGYMADAEINQIIEKDNTAKNLYDKESDSNILVYNLTQWVAYMNGSTKRSRTELYQSLNMGGTTDWAVDLQLLTSSSGGNGNDYLKNQTTVYIDPSVWTDENPRVKCPGPCVLVLPDYPLSSSTVLTRPPHTTTLDVAWQTPTRVTNSKGDVVTTTAITRILQETTISAPPITITKLPMANINITIPLREDDNVTFTPKPRFPTQVVTVTNDRHPLETNVTQPLVTRSVTLPPWPQTTAIYIPPSEIKDKDEDEDENDDEDDNDEDDEEDNDDDDDDDHNLPIIPVITVSEGPGDPTCKSNCGKICSDPFCICSEGCDGSDTGFADPNDPNPPPNPNSPENGDYSNDDKPSSSCTAQSTVTNFWVSCESEGPTSTSCTTTSSMVAVGCDVTASTTTTGMEECYSIDPNEDQGEDGTGYSVTPRPTSATATATSSSSSTTTTEDPGSPTPSETAYGCKGSTFCKTFTDLKSFCDVAKGYLTEDRIYGTKSDDQDTGACYTDGAHAGGGCGVFVEGKGCEMDGKTMAAGCTTMNNGPLQPALPPGASGNGTASSSTNSPVMGNHFHTVGPDVTSVS